jgi:hypothetical protein
MSLPGRPVPYVRADALPPAARCGPPLGRGRVVTRWSHHGAHAAFSHLVGLAWGRRRTTPASYLSMLTHVALVPSITQGRGALERSLAAGVLHAGITWQVQHGLPVLLEGLTRNGERILVKIVYLQYSYDSPLRELHVKRMSPREADFGIRE